jgi:hypothetical protein
MAATQPFLPVTICRHRIAHINRLAKPECLLVNGSKVTLSPLIAAHIHPADDISFPLLNSSVAATTETYLTKNSPAGSGQDVYQAQIGYVTQPKKDKRDEFFVAAEVCPADLGISSILISCEVLREYFYRIPKREPSSRRQTLYDLLHISSTASRVLQKSRFELRHTGSPFEDAALEGKAQSRFSCYWPVAASPHTAIYKLSHQLLNFRGCTSLGC